MSKQDDGFGHKAGPNPGPQADFARRPNMPGAPGMPPWGNNALNAQPARGLGQPGRPVTGQRPMFGGGSPVFAPMPSYTPVTRGPDPRQQIPQPPQPAYDPYAHIPPQPNRPMPQQGLGHPSPQGPSHLNYPDPGYQATQHPNAQRQMAAPGYQTTDFGGQAYQQPRPPGFPGAEHPGSQQPYPAPNYGGAQGAPGQAYGDQSFADASFPETNAGDASFPETGFDQNFADANFSNQDFSGSGFADPGVPQPGFDASFPEQVFPGAEPFEHQDPPGPDSYGQQNGQLEQGFEPFADETAQDFGGQVPQSDPRRQLQAFDAVYDQPPQIPLGPVEPARNQSQDFYEGERLDADFLDETQILAAQGDPAKAGSTLKSRSAVMVGAALLGAIALGGALAVAYRQSGGGLGSEPPPLVQADSSPVKAAPDEPGGKQFPHKNKLIYDRLQNADDPQSEKLVPRQEDVAVPALPGSDTGGTPAAVATTDNAPPTTQAVPGAVPVPAVNDPSMDDGGPRKVKTMVVRPDGSVEAAAVPEVPAEAAQPQAEPQAQPQAQEAVPQAAPPPQPANAAPQETASVPEPEAKPKPQQVAAAAPQAAPTPKEYVVQVASKKNQTDALASFADMQQKYPTLLSNYRPIVQKANLGAKGTWYRLRIGPVADKTAANKLCSQLKTQGLPDCLVIAQ